MLIKGGPFEKGPPFLFSFLRNLLPVCQKLLDANIGQRILNQLLHHRIGNRRHTRSDEGCLGGREFLPTTPSSAHKQMDLRNDL